MAGKQVSASRNPAVKDGTRNRPMSISGSSRVRLSRRSRRTKATTSTVAGTANQCRAGQVEAVPAQVRVGGQQPAAEQDHRQPDRDVDEEHQSPTQVLATEGDHGAADERTGGGGHADRRAQHAEGATALVSPE